jgi:hypothetical protein
MLLEPEKVERYYETWWSVLSFVNRELGILPRMPSRSEDGSWLLSDAVMVRDAVWEHESLRERFLSENPDDLPESELMEVAGWKDRVAGQFFVERYLKKHTVFIESSTSQVYGVLGLKSPFESLFGSKPPYLIEGVLLPYHGRVIPDGLFKRTGVEITFGSGIKRMLRDTYNTARDEGRIITSFGPNPRGIE